MNSKKPSVLKERIIQDIRLIPKSKVVYFGLLGQRQQVSGQVVGWILSGMPEAEWVLCPWHRVVAKDGFISSKKLGSKGDLQEELLLKEGVQIIQNRVDMKKHLWFFD